MHGNDIFVNRVVHSVGKSLRKHPVKPLTNGMDAAINRERIDIGVKRVQEIRSEVLFALFLEFKSIFQVEFRLVEDSDFHDTRSRISFLAASQAVNC